MSTRLIPPHTELTEPYWQAAREERLVIQQCNACDHWLFPPGANCPRCGSEELSWTPVSGKGVIYTYTIAYRPPHPVLTNQTPITVAVVELEEGPRMTSNIIGCDPDTVEIGMPVTVAFEAIDDSDLVLPMFSPSTNP